MSVKWGISIKEVPCAYTLQVGGPSSTTEATLFQQARAECSTSLNKLMERYNGLIQAIVRQQVVGD